MYPCQEKGHAIHCEFITVKSLCLGIFIYVEMYLILDNRSRTFLSLSVCYSFSRSKWQGENILLNSFFFLYENVSYFQAKGIFSWNPSIKTHSEFWWQAIITMTLSLKLAINTPNSKTELEQLGLFRMRNF